MDSRMVTGCSSGRVAGVLPVVDSRQASKGAAVASTGSAAEFDGRVALVLGGSGGIGLASAALLAGAGRR